MTCPKLTPPSVVGLFLGSQPNRYDLQMIASIALRSGWFEAAIDVPELRAKLVARDFPVGRCGSDLSAFFWEQKTRIGGNSGRTSGQ
jgi:hypothetical protein